MTSQQDVSSIENNIRQISAIYEISQAVHSLSTEDLLKLVTKTAATVMDAEACSLMLKNPFKDELEIRAEYGLAKEIVEGARVRYGEGIAGHVAQTGEPMLLNDVSDDPRFEQTAVVPNPQIASSICVPLRDEEGNVQGVLSVRRKMPAPLFGEVDVKLFSVFASQVGLAISNAHLYTRLNERIAELSSLYETSQKLGEAYDLENASRVLVEVAQDITRDESIMLLLMDSTQQVIIKETYGIPKSIEDAVLGLINGKNGAGWGYSNREMINLLVGEPQEWPEAIKPIVPAIKDHLSRVTMIPLIAEDAVIGMLIMGSKKKEKLDPRKGRMLSIVVSQAATIFKNASYHKEQMEQKVLELTALYQLSERISTASNLQEALDSILDIVRDTVWYDEIFIATTDYERSVMTIQVCRGMNNGLQQGSEFSLEDDVLVSWAVEERKALVSPDITKDRFHQPSVRSDKVRSLMTIPLVVHDDVVGVLNVHGYATNLYTEDNARVLSVIASQAAALYKELQALSALANYTDNILRSIAAGVLTLDRDGRVLTWNKAAEDIIGINAHDVVGKHFSEVVDDLGLSQKDRNSIMNEINNVVSSGRKYLGYKQEYHPIGKPPLHINMSISQLRDDAKEMLGLVIIFEDVTKEVQLEDEMRKIAELAAVGQLAASIAHELRNPLSSIKGAAQYLKREYSDHAAVCEFLDIIIEEVNILNGIATEFLDFARPTKLNLREIDINDVIFRTVQFMQLEFVKGNVTVEQNLSYESQKITADDKQLDQVFRNIFLNALQAMPYGGKLLLSTKPENHGVKVLVEDTGVGISKEALEQIFVPFFTTKTKGTGLGLSIVKKIVDNHDGNVSVNSKPGKGTTFELYLPISSDKAKVATMRAEDVAKMGEADFLRRGQPMS